MSKIILASASPRRSELLKKAGIDFCVEVADVVEKVPDGATPQETVESLALQKAEAVAMKNPNAVVIGADTVVALDNKILGKPKTKENAVQMLKMLSGRTHKVFTGVAIIANGKVDIFHEETQVSFYALTDDEISAYVETGEPMDKAGAYGIQGKGCTLVDSICGDYFNVVGLPISKVYRKLGDY